MPDLRIVQLSGSSDGGIARHVRQLATDLATDHRVILAGPQQVITGTNLHTWRVPISDRPQLGDTRNLAAIRTVAKGADVLHAHGLRAGALAALALSTPALSRTALVVTLHNAPVGSASTRSVAGGLLRAISARANAVLGVSNDLVSWARSHHAKLTDRALIPAPKFQPGKPLAPQQRASLGIAENSKVVLTLARLAPQKGLGLLADVAGLLADRVEPLTWLVAGSGPLRDQLADQIAGEDLPIVLLGRRDDVPSLLATADVLASTSAWEGQPINIQEALQAGLPVVATDVGGTKEVTADAALLAPYPDAGAMTAQLTEVLTKPEVAQRMREASLARATSLPSVSDSLRQTLETYAKVIA